jgi:tetratricopeptide (TPR) repeat protein
MKKTGIYRVIIIITLVVAILVPVVMFGYKKVEANSNSTEYDVLVTKGQGFYKERLYSKSLKSYSDAIELVPTKLDAYEGAVQILLEKSLEDEFMEIMDVASGQLSSSEMSQLWTLIGDRYIAQQKYAEAVQAFQSVSSVNDDVKDGLFLAYIGIGDVNKAGEFIRTESEYYDIWSVYQAQLDEDDLYIIVKESKNLINEGFPWLAVDLLLDHKEEMSEYWEGNYFLGRAFFDAGEYDESMNYLEKSLLLDADEPGVYLLFARIYLEQGDLNKAYEYYERALNYSVEDKHEDLIKAEYVSLLLDNGVNTRAQEILGESEDDSLNVYRLKAFLNIGDDEGIAELTTSYSEGMKNDIEFLRMLAKYQIVSDNLDQAQQSLDLLESNTSFDPSYFYLLALFNLAQDNPEDAKLNLEKSIEFDLDGNITQEALKEVQKL